MKRLLTIIALALIGSLANAQNGVTFVVDENLEPLNDKYFMEHLQRVVLRLSMAFSMTKASPVTHRPR